VKLTILVFLLLAALATPAEPARLKDLANVRGVRSNQLIGYGLVVGLNGTGDDQQVYFTLRSVQLMLRRLGVKAAQEKVFNLRNLRLRNTAAVMVTANLPPFARMGGRIDVTVSSLGNAKSLQGGTLLMTPLRGVDLKIYALGQGPISVGGFTVGGRTGSRLTRNHTTAGRIPGGAIIEREVPSRFVREGKMVVALTRPDFTTAQRLATAINRELGKKVASAADPATIQVRVPREFRGREVQLASRMELVQVQPDAPAQVIINERTGTVVVGQEVRISPVAISHGSLTLEVSERFRVSQPRAPFGTGRTRVVPETQVKAREGQGDLKLVPGAANLADVVKALNALGASPRDLVAILQALKSAGAMSAKVVVQ
jgi:flagellar P-ring protein precursor FlgI